MKKLIISIVSVIISLGLYGQCNPNPEIDIPEGYDLVKRIDVSMPANSDAIRTYDFAMINRENYRFLFIEEEKYINKASYDLYEESILLGTNNPGGKFYASFDFHCKKGKTYRLKASRLTDEDYCGYCLLLKKKNGESVDKAGSEQVSDETVFFIVEEMPLFVEGRGVDAFTEWVGENLVYPEEARKKGIQGRVFVTFVLDAGGNVKDVKVIRGVDGILDQEAYRVVSSSPKWYRSGHQRGKPVNVQYTIPVIFKMN